MLCCFLLIATQLGFFLWSKLDKGEQIQFSEIKDIERELDSLALVASNRNKPSYRINANYISDYKGYQLGMTVDQIDRMFAYRSKGKYFRDLQQFQTITGIHDSVKESLESVIVFPKFPMFSKSDKGALPKSSVPKDGDLNKISYNQLLLLQIDNRMARRILAYRKKLRGFSLDDQLYEVYDLDSAQVKSILNHFSVRTVPSFKKVNINTASFKELLKLPYMNYGLVKSICDERDRILGFENLSDIKKIDSFPLDKFDRIALYLTAE